jgi:hypothetical protein
LYVYAPRVAEFGLAANVCPKGSVLAHVHRMAWSLGRTITRAVFRWSA